MFLKVVLAVVVTVISIVQCNNLKLGRATPRARRIFERVRRGTPGDWRSARYVTIEAPRRELISAVYVTDLSEFNDGVAFIKKGGIGKRGITLGLKSSKHQNGSRFQLKVFAEKTSPRGFLEHNRDRVIAVELREAPGRIKTPYY